MPRVPDAIPDATFRLLLASGVGATTFRRITDHFASHDDAVSAGESDLARIDGIGRHRARTIREGIAQADPDAERDAMARAGAEVILLGDDDYPALLAAIDDPPPALWVRGSITPSDRLAVAIVGSRKCTAYGRDQAARFAGLLAESGLSIVSGGAFGIDAAAHRAALRSGGRTIAVLGSGLARPYPSEHADLFDSIGASGGAVISEFPMQAGPRAEHFPRRNRIISGLSLGVLVIEAAKRSGALITARLAAEDHNRDVMMLPGRVDSPASAGCLKALREGWAALVTSHADVLEQLDAADHLVRGAMAHAGQERESEPSLLDHGLSPGQQQIVTMLEDAGEPVLVDQIAARSELPMSQVMADLTLLQIRGRIQRDHRGVMLKR